jgi:hypothetical protein
VCVCVYVYVYVYVCVCVCVYDCVYVCGNVYRTKSCVSREGYVCVQMWWLYLAAAGARAHTRGELAVREGVGSKFDVLECCVWV